MSVKLIKILNKRTKNFEKIFLKYYLNLKNVEKILGEYLQISDKCGVNKFVEFSENFEDISGQFCVKLMKIIIKILRKKIT